VEKNLIESISKKIDNRGDMGILRKDPRLDAVVNADAICEVIADTFNFTEGPIWHPAEKHLTFSDIPENKLYRYQAGEVRTYRQPSNMANGNTYDKLGRLLSCEHATSRVVVEADGELEVLASHYAGKELNSPNDIVVRSDGDIFFTDPTYGRSGGHGVKRDTELEFQGVYRIRSDGALTLLGKDFNQPNGLCWNLDETALYVADTPNKHVRRFDYDGETLSGGEVFCASPAPDGLKIDSQGYLYAGGPGGVGVYHPDGSFLGVIQTPEFCANFTWGDADLQTLYLTASTTLFRVRVNIPGIPLF
jgi:gluconolactonase